MFQRFSASFDTDLYDALKVCAAGDRRSANQMLSILLAEALAARGIISPASNNPTPHHVLDY